MITNPAELTSFMSQEECKKSCSVDSINKIMATFKCEEVSAFLDVEFLQNVPNVGMAQKQVKSLLSYCLGFLREYGQACRDIEPAELQRTTDSLYRPKSLLVVLIDDLIYVFHTHFDRGLKVRLFLLDHTGDDDNPCGQQHFSEVGARAF
jgi:hypothetical protein